MKFGLLEQLSAYLRHAPVRRIRDCLQRGAEHGLKVTPAQWESHHHSGGNIEDVLEALIYAAERGLALSFARATAINLTLISARRGGTVLEWVKQCDQQGVKNLNTHPVRL